METRGGMGMSGGERLRVSQAYNLDKKQTIIALIEDVLAAL